MVDIYSPWIEKLAILTIETIYFVYKEGTGRENCSVDVKLEGGEVDGIFVDLKSRNWLADKIEKRHNSDLPTGKTVTQIENQMKIAFDRLEEFGVLKFGDAKMSPGSEESTKKFHLNNLPLEKPDKWKEKISILFQDRRAELKANPTPKRTAPTHIPYIGAQEYVGHSKLLETIHTTLISPQSTPNRGAFCLLHGMPGVGKTEAALQYAAHQRDFYKGGILWIHGRGDSPDTALLQIATQIINFAKVELGLKPKECKDGEEASLAKAYLDKWKDTAKNPILIIFDDLTEDTFNGLEKEKLLPNSEQFRVLITSRYFLGSSVPEIEVKELEDSAALELLHSTSNLPKETWEDSKNQETAREIAVEFLGGLPLGIELVGGYLNRSKRNNLASVLEKLQASGLKTSSVSRTPDATMTAQRGLWAAIDLSWQELDEGAKDLAMRLGLCAHAPIPWDMVVACYPEGTDIDEVGDKLDFQLIKGSLTKYFEYDTSDDNEDDVETQVLLSLHQVIYEFFQEQYRAKDEEYKTTLRLQYFHGLRALIAPLNVEGIELEEVDKSKYVFLHAVEAVDGICAYGDMQLTGLILRGLRRAFEIRGEIGRAIEVGQKFVDELSKNRLLGGYFGKEAINSLSALYTVNGQLTKAQDLLRPKKAQDFDVSTFEGRAELVLAYAQTLYDEKVSEIEKETIGFSSKAANLIKMGNIKTLEGRYKEAEAFLFQAQLEILALESPNPLLLAGLYTGIADVSSVQHLYLDAVKFYRLAIQVLEEHEPTAKGTIAALHRSLGQIFLDIKQLDEAEECLEKSLKWVRSAYKKDHPHVASALDSLAQLRQEQKRYQEAEELFQEALRIDKKLTPHSNDVAGILTNLGGLYLIQNKLREAEKALKEALEINRANGFEVKRRTLPMIGLLTIYQRQQRYQEYVDQLIELIKVRRSQGRGDYAEACEAIADLYKELLNNEQEAKEWMKEAQVARQQQASTSNTETTSYPMNAPGEVEPPSLSM